jgi:serine/threonine protein kinase
MNNLIGYTLGQYRIVDQIGEGGMASVFRAYQASLNRYVALKVLPPIHAKQPGFSERFRREAEAVASLNHPNILPVYDFGQEDGYSYIAMRFVEGARTLKEEMAERLSLGRAADLIGQIAAALDCAHRQGIVHRDVKPANVLMDGDWALLTDFGLARMTEASVKLTGSGVGVGTPAYMSPEQGQGLEIDHRSDIYSLGVILFEMLTGKIPHDAETPFAIVLKRVTEPLPMPRAVNPAIPEAVERVILKALAREPGDRFASAGDLAQALKQAVGTAEAGAVPLRAAAPEPVHAPESPTLPSEPVRTLQPPTQPLATASGPTAVQAVVPVPAPSQPERQAPTQAATAVQAAVPVPTPPQPERQAPAEAAAAAPPRTRRPFPWKWVLGIGAALVVVALAIWAGSMLLGGGTAGGEDSMVLEKDGSTLVRVEGGEFWVGSDDPDALENERPRFQAVVDSFWIGQTEVTNAQYRQCVEEGACTPPSELGSCDRDSYYDNPEFDNYPVVSVTWYQARAYAGWVGGRLPTEIEWEYAARGPDEHTYPWGDDPPDESLLNYNSHVGDTSEVGAYPAGESWCGALDMAGNVWEWTQGLYQPYPYESAYGREDSGDPGLRVVRGGAFFDDEYGVRAAFRHDWGSNEGHCSKGFRVLVPIEQ